MSSTGSNTTLAHTHSGRHCPVSGEHEYCPPQDGDSRSPCPALNAMANHGYIPRDGNKVSAFNLIQGLRSCYGLSLPFACFLSFGGFFLLRRIKPVSLYHIGKHDAIEHNASLVHEDCPESREYASIKVVKRLVDSLTHREDSVKSSFLGIKELADFRVRRERECAALDRFHGVIARGEMAIVFGIWGEKAGQDGVPKAWLRDWFQDGRLPKDWKPSKKQGLLDTIRISNQLKTHMEEIKTESTATK